MEGLLKLRLCSPFESINFQFSRENMGAHQSLENNADTATRARITETANFDFRQNIKIIISLDLISNLPYPYILILYKNSDFHQKILFLR